MDYSRFEQIVAKRDVGKYAEALEELDELLDSPLDAQNRATLLGVQCVCLWNLGRLPEARLKLEEAKSISRGPHQEFLDGILTLAEGKDEEGISMLRSFLEKHAYLKDPASHPDSYDPDVYLNALDELGQRLAYLNRFSEAIIPLEEARDVAPPERRPGICYQLGVCYRETGQLKMAEERYRESLELDCSDPQWAEAQYSLGWLLFQRGEFNAAEAAFKTCELLGTGASPEVRQLVRGWLDETSAHLRKDSSVQ